MSEGSESIELFGIARRLPEVTTPCGVTLAVNKLSELAHDSSIISLYQFMGEELEIAQDQFLEGCALLLSSRNSEDGVLSPEDAIVGYVRANGGVLVTLSCDGQRLYESGPEDPDCGWPSGTLILSPAPIHHPFAPAFSFSKTTFRFS